MKRSLTIARVAGVPIRVHWTFSLLILYVALSPGGTTASVAGTDALWLGVLFASVTAHELSHSIVARRLGLEVRDIVLLPIGGVSEIVGMEISPAVESRVAIAGPLASVLLGVLFLLIALATGASLWPPALSTGSWLTRIGWLNLALAAFNLLPALPMDGGRVFRSLLARSGNRVRATRTAAAVAGAFGVAMVAYGLERDYFLVLIGAFVLMGATSEWQGTRVRVALQTMTVGAFMHPDSTTLPAAARALDVAEWLSHFPGRGVPIVNDLGQYLGIVDQGDVTKIARTATAAPVACGPTTAPEAPATEPGHNMLVGAVSDRQAPILAPEMELFPTAVEAFRTFRRQQLAVVAGGRVVGVLYRAPVGAALAQAQHAGQRSTAGL
ncbi:MAG: site-2 protease family protein [Acidimicrobiales bacterium]